MNSVGSVESMGHNGMNARNFEFSDTVSQPSITPVSKPAVALLLGASPAMQEVIRLIERVGPTEASVLLTGESGSGKELAARMIHECSARHGKPFIAINCGAIPAGLIEAELFGYEKGSFTGAQAAHPGKFEQAQGGTLLLDEITEMPLALQAKLLRVLQEREVERIGSRTAIALDVRVLATTNRRLREEVAAGRFREDLYYRLNVFPLALSPLRLRRDDVLPLAMQLLANRCRPGERIPALSAEAAHLLLTYPWPGNVRELDNLLQRALILVNGPVIRPEHIQFELANEGVASSGGGIVINTLPRHASVKVISDIKSAASKDTAPNGRSLANTLGQAERDLILDALRNGQGNRREAAERLGISPRTLRYKLARLREAGIDVPAA